MSLRQWWASLFAPAAPRRPRRSAVISLETLPDRTAPSVGPFVDDPPAPPGLELVLLTVAPSVEVAWLTLDRGFGITLAPAAPPAWTPEPPADTPTTGGTVDAPAPTTPATPPTGVIVIPLRLAPGQPLMPESPVFRIAARIAPTAPVTVLFTLAAHGSAGTTAAPGVVTLTSAAPQATARGSRPRRSPPSPGGTSRPSPVPSSASWATGPTPRT
jgi:hypothetical protein